MILDSFAEEMNRNIEIYSQGSGETVYDPNTGAYTTTPSNAKKVYGVGYYEGSSATQFVSDRLKADITGVFVAYPDSVGVVKDSDKITLENGREFEVVHSEDIMNLGQVMSIGVKEIT